MIVADVQPVAPDFAIGKVLEQQSARDAAGLVVVPRGEPDQAGDLFGLFEIMFCRCADRRTFERDDPLIAFAGGRLIKGDGEKSFTE